MQSISPKKIIIAGCLGCILLTLLTKPFVHEIINPQWYSAKSSSSRDNDKESITVHFHERRPFYLSYKHEVNGLIADPIAQAFNLADIAYRWQETPAKRQLDIIKQNQDKSCAAGWLKTADKETFAQYSVPIYQNQQFVAIFRAENSLVDETEQLEEVLNERRLQLLVKAGYSYGQYIDTRLTHHKPRLISTTVNNLNMLKMIQSHRADYCFMTEEEAKDLLLFSGLKRSDFKIVYFANMPAGNKRYIICSKMVDEETMDYLNGAIRYLINTQDDN